MVLHLMTFFPLCLREFFASLTFRNLFILLFASGKITLMHDFTYFITIIAQSTEVNRQTQQEKQRSNTSVQDVNHLLPPGVKQASRFVLCKVV